MVGPPRAGDRTFHIYEYFFQLRIITFQAEGGTISNRGSDHPEPRQLWKKVFSVDGKEGHFPPHHSPPPRSRGSCHVGSMIINFGRKFLVSMARKVASLHSP
jgi:hypothetical protein